MPDTILLKNGRLIDPAAGVDRITDILIEDGIIRRIDTAIAPSEDCRVITLDGKIVAPGFVDIHVHLREPGYEHKETIETGTLSAAWGGFTAVCCMPNTNPAIDDESIVQFVQSQGKKSHGGVVDVYPIGAVTKGREGKIMAPIAELVQAGAVGLSDDGAPVHDAGIMRRAMEYASMYDVPIIQHCEDMSLAKGGVMNEGESATRLGLPGIPNVAEEVMIARDVMLAEFTRARYHAAHLSTAGAVELIREAKRKGVNVTCEVTPHHFSLTDKEVFSFDTNTKMNPPLRSQADVDAVKEGLRDGTIDVIATDHAPHSLDEKEVDYIQAPFGIVGLETAIGLAVTELVKPGVLTLSKLIEKFSTNPRRIIGREIRVEEGQPAVLTLFDPEIEWTVDCAGFHSKSKNSPFNGTTLRGKSVGIVNNGLLFLNEEKAS
ncbi:MAG TPA: dihydroorotase [Bacteroidota bacterium]|nr:dihydroorotase [Bacteroidota bacterium]